ncbi:hypothetical protein [Catenovulum sediminis]|uniref:Uncharacterized protein n=1 Tax=Catenovulum sediminis TaxID=1740262 RepID=A0ABV1RHV9_9ALTE
MTEFLNLIKMGGVFLIFFISMILAVEVPESFGFENGSPESWIIGGIVFFGVSFGSVYILSELGIFTKNKLAETKNKVVELNIIEAVKNALVAKITFETMDPEEQLLIVAYVALSAANPTINITQSMARRFYEDEEAFDKALSHVQTIPPFTLYNCISLVFKEQEIQPIFKNYKWKPVTQPYKVENMINDEICYKAISAVYSEFGFKSSFVSESEFV